MTFDTRFTLTRGSFELNVDISFHEGEVVAIMGPNGSGKTTLIKCILGMVIPDMGVIKMNHESILGRWK